jgi:hypothetical protein
MGLQKLNAIATSTIQGNVTVATTTTIIPSVQRFFASVTLSLGSFTIGASNFRNDNGNTVSALPSPPTYGYYNVYINGNLQPAGSVTLATTGLTIASTLAALSSIAIEVVDLSNVTSSSSASHNFTVTTDITS